jgi:hypothetical protein
MSWPRAKPSAIAACSPQSPSLLLLLCARARVCVCVCYCSLCGARKQMEDAFVLLSKRLWSIYIIHSNARCHPRRTAWRCRLHLNQHAIVCIYVHIYGRMTGRLIFKAREEGGQKLTSFGVTVNICNILIYARFVTFCREEQVQTVSWL